MDKIDFISEKASDVFGRLQTTAHQNVFDADFEYSTQPLRWDGYTAGSATIIHLPQNGGARLSVTTSANDVAIRQSRIYQRYQPGKMMTMSSAVLFGPPVTNNRQRVGFFDDGNGVFWEQGDPTAANPSGMAVVVRSDAGTAGVQELRITADQWLAAGKEPAALANINWQRIQMVGIDYAWYGAGQVRWWVLVNGIKLVCHSIGFGNRPTQVVPWARTGNLPVRYELRNVGTIATPQSIDHYGVSVLVDGRADDQRGFTYTYGRQGGSLVATVTGAQTRLPLLSIRNRVMGNTMMTLTASSGSTTTATGTFTSGTQTAPPATNALVGRLAFVSAGTGAGQVARITANTGTSVTVVDSITGNPLGVSLGNTSVLQIGLINRGQILPRRLNISTTGAARIELISNATLTGPNWEALSGLGSPNSFAERDITASALSGGEVVYGMTIAQASGQTLAELQTDQLFPLGANILGNIPDRLTVAITSSGSLTASVELNCQEAMS